ncbi:MAG: mechanosensitive ion channel protein [Opitutales bacterium TMED158]|nr:MAG: mechanosensitive ion channel protein [Opitutales bacterium TMED158]
MNEEGTSTDTTEFVKGLIEWATTDGLDYALKALLALAIFIIGKWIAGALRNRIRSAMQKREVDPALVSFGTSIIYYVLMIAVVLAAIQQVGFQTTSLVAILGAAGLAVGLALQGSLSNFAAGVLIIMFRPFKIGDVIDAGGAVGKVNEIGVLVTIMTTADNKKIIMPNSSIMAGSITNITANDTRRVDMVVGVSYSDDLDKVQGIILEILNADERVLKDPEPQVVVAELADSSVNFNVRPWCATGDYWGVFFDFQKAIKQRLDQEGVSIPFPQQDVYMHQVSQ